jgi:hypothetical protein
MNASFDGHFEEEVFEEYALGMRSEEDCKSLEEHLLICSACQDLLAEMDEYVEAAKAASALLAGKVRPPSKRAMSAATVVGVS